jgi:hypothetical protein
LQVSWQTAIPSPVTNLLSKQGECAWAHPGESTWSSWRRPAGSRQYHCRSF